MKRASFFPTCAVMILAGLFLAAGREAFAQSLREEVQERGVEEFARDVAERKKIIAGKLYKHVKITYGYDTNPRLSSDRQDDDFESFRLGIDYRRTFAERHQYAVSAQVAQQNYNEITSLSNTLGNLGLDYKYALTKAYVVGLGHNLSAAYYDKSSDSEFMLNKIYVNFQHRISPKFFHKIQYEFGMKHYDEARALSTSTTTYKDGRRRDLSDAAIYSVGYTMTEKFSANVSLRYTDNDSNSDFQDYHDYDAYDVTPRLYYKFSEALSGTLSYSYKYKRYDDRVVGSTDSEQIDRISRADVGLNYEFNDSHSVNLNYSYNGNSSNSDSSDYTGSSVEVGWRYNF